MTKQSPRLLNQFIPEKYTLRIEPNQSKMTFTGSVTVRGRKVGRPSQRLTFHQKDLKIDHAVIKRIDKKPQEFTVDRINTHATFDEVRLHTTEQLFPGEYEVTMHFSGKITRGMTGIYPSFFKIDGEEHVLIGTQFESHHAREAFPCIDEPAAKAVFELAITHDSNLKVLGNTPVETAEATGKKTTTTFAASPKMSSYLLAFVVGDIHAVSGKTKSGVEVNIWGVVSQPKERFAFALDVAIRTIEFFEDYFNVPYPLPKADHIGLPDFSSGAMENWGLITYREIALLLDPKNPSQSAKELIALVVAHETSHQWFGNLVTMEWWDDLWLNESFANIMEYAAIDALFPEWNVWDMFVAAEGLSAIRRDAIPGVQPVRLPVHHPEEISTLFDPSIVYAKGGRVLYMLMHYIGETAWRKGLTEYFKTHAYGNTTGADLWHSLSKASGIDVAAFMDPWIEQSGFPLVRVRQKNSDLTVAQHHFLEEPSKADDRLWPVPLFADTTQSVLTTAEQTFSDMKPLQTINQGSRGHYIVHYESSEQRDLLRTQAKEMKLAPSERLMLLNDSVMLAHGGQASLSETLELLEAYENEDTETVWDMMSIVLGDVRKFIDLDESIESKIKSLTGRMVKKQIARLGWEEKPNESSSDTKLRATIVSLGVYTEESDYINKALELFDLYRKNPSSVPAELRIVAFVAAIKQDHDDAFAYLFDLYTNTNDSDLQRDISSALCATRDSKKAQKILNNLTDPKVIKPQDADRWFVFMLRNRHLREQAWQWMEENWSWVEETYGNDKNFDYWPRYCASACNTAHWQKRYLDFFADKREVILLQRNIQIGEQEIASRVQWLERDLSPVQNYFNKAL